jgi:hypothetical protein
MILAIDKPALSRAYTQSGQDISLEHFTMMEHDGTTERFPKAPALPSGRR